MAIVPPMLQNEQSNILVRKKRVEPSGVALQTPDTSTSEQIGSQAQPTSLLPALPATGRARLTRPTTPAVRQYILQTKLMVGAASDAYEQEADRMSDQVVSQQPTVPAPAVQRDEMSEEEDEQVQLLRRKADTSGPQTSEAGGAQGGALEPEMEQTLQGARGDGQALDAATRAKMEHGFRADFSGVKVHTDSKADTLNRSLHSRAFTTGQDIFFRSNEYQPGANTGQKLLAHELTHVVQQNGPQVQRKADRAHTGTGPTIQREWNWEEFKQRRRDGWRDWKQNRRQGWADFKQGVGNRVDNVKNTNRARGGKEDADYLDLGTPQTATGLVENVTGITGLFGTGGAGNTGISDVGRGGTTTGDWMNSQFASHKNDMLSGVSDSIGGVAGVGGNIMGGLEAISILKDPNASKAHKTQAGLGLLSNTAGAGSNVAKTLGGISTADGGWGSSGMFNNSVSGVSKSTDIKAVGDWLGIASGGLGLMAGTVGAGRDFSKWKKDLKSGKFATKDQGGRGNKAFARSFGRGAKSLTGIASSGASIARGSSLLAGQIQGGGQLASNFASTAAGTAATTAGLVGGGLGVATGAMDMLSGGFKMWKASKRKKKIGALGNQGFAGVNQQDQADALAHLKEIQTKKSREGKYSVAAGVLGTAAGALTLSGVGAIGGVALGATVGALKLGRWGFNKIRQHRRDVKDKKELRIRQDLTTAGVNLTDQQWEGYLQAKDARLEQRANSGGLKGIRGKIEKKFKADRTKSSANKDERYDKTAATLLAMHASDPNAHILRSLLSISDNQLEGNQQAQIDMIKSALKKR